MSTSGPDRKPIRPTRRQRRYEAPPDRILIPWIGGSAASSVDGGCDNVIMPARDRAAR